MPDMTDKSTAAPEGSQVGAPSVEVIDEQKQQAILDKYDSDSAAEKKAGNWTDTICTVVSVGLMLYCLWTSFFGAPEATLHRAIFLICSIPMMFLTYPMFKKNKGKAPKWYDFVFIGLTLLVCGYVILNHHRIVTGSGIASDFECILFGLMLLVVIEGVRRTNGWAITIIIAIFILYALLGKYAPGLLRHAGLTWRRMTSQMLLTNEGFFGGNVGTMAGMVTIFIMFASFMEKTGVGDFINNFALSIFGRASGGPAKVSVITSAMFGMISGNAVSNVVTTGAFTIPMMKKTGYDSEFAGAVEAVSSTAGQLMPPVMGASAFLMANITGIPYVQICIAALVPVFLYYVGVFAQVHLRAKKLGLVGVPKDQCPKLWDVIKNQGYLFIPFIFVIVMLMMGYTPTWVGTRAILVSLLVACFKSASRLSLKDIIGILAVTGKRILSLAVVCSGISLISGVCNLTGITQILCTVILKLTAGNLIATMLLIALICIVLGMGLPTASVYMLLSTVAAPALVQGYGVPVLAAHLFVFYFGLLANVTPPVCLPAYAAAGLADSNPAQTGYAAFKLALGGFIVPFVFVGSPDLLFINAGPDVIVKIITATCGVFLLGAATEGWLKRKMPLAIRILCVVGAAGMIIPEPITDFIGIGIFVGVLLFETAMAKKTAAAAA